MISEMNELAIGFDLTPKGSQLTFYNRQNSGPMTVSLVPGEERYLLNTPEELFPLIAQGKEEGVELLTSFFRDCMGLLDGTGRPDNQVITVTMEKMDGVWARAIIQALESLKIPEQCIYLQDHRESFFWFTLNQRKELWTYKVALFHYEDDRIRCWRLGIDRKTKPALVEIEKFDTLRLDDKARAGRNDEDWNAERDRLFLKHIQRMFGKDTYSCAYLTGEAFSKEWAKESLAFLCRRRKVFLGQNLYTRGACHASMEYAHMSKMGDYLYKSPDMIEQNLGMEMIIRGHKEFYPMISAGINWYMARHQCEFILDDVRDLVLYSKSLSGEMMEHRIALPGLPNRPNRATRLRLSLSFKSRDKCLVRLQDLGLGGLYPATDKTWDAEIDFSKGGRGA